MSQGKFSHRKPYRLWLLSPTLPQQLKICHMVTIKTTEIPWSPNPGGLRLPRCWELLASFPFFLSMAHILVHGSSLRISNPWTLKLGLKITSQWHSSSTPEFGKKDNPKKTFRSPNRWWGKYSLLYWWWIRECHLTYRHTPSLYSAPPTCESNLSTHNIRP